MTTFASTQDGVASNVTTEAKTIQVAAGVTQEQIADLGKQYGIDVVSPHCAGM